VGPHRVPAAALLCQRFHAAAEGLLHRYRPPHAVNSVNESKFATKHEEKVMLDFIVTEAQLKPPEDFTSVCEKGFQDIMNLNYGHL
jgi:hypothetical protein